jgi:hypothetical protein
MSHTGYILSMAGRDRWLELVHSTDKVRTVPSALTVALYLWKLYSCKTGELFPSVETLERKTGLCNAAVRKGLTLLRKHGLLEVLRPTRWVRKYALILPKHLQIDKYCRKVRLRKAPADSHRPEPAGPEPQDQVPADEAAEEAPTDPLEPLQCDPKPCPQHIARRAAEALRERLEQHENRITRLSTLSASIILAGVSPQPWTAADRWINQIAELIRFGRLEVQPDLTIRVRLE